MNEFERVAAQQLAGAVAEQPFHRRTGVANDAVVAKNRDDVGRVFSQRTEMLFALTERFFDARALQRGREHVRERLQKEHIRTAEFPRLRAVGAEHTPGSLTALHRNADSADDAMRFEMRRQAEASLDGGIFEHERPGGAQDVSRQPAGIRGDKRPPDAALAPTGAGTEQQAAVLGFELQDVAELDVEPARQQCGRRLKEIAARDARKRLLAEVGNGLLLSCRRTKLQLGAARFLDA